LAGAVPGGVPVVCETGAKKQLLKRINKTCYPTWHLGLNLRSRFSTSFDEDSSMKLRSLFWAVSLTFVMLAPAAEAQEKAPHAAMNASKLELNGGWMLQSSRKVDQGGEALSKPGFEPKGWYPVTVPTTVVSALVKHKVLPDPTYGMNLRQMPGVTYPIGANFSNLPMGPDSPYLLSWWYRKTFSVPASDKGKTLWLNFRGINYRANIWLNGKQIANSDDVAGAWRTYEFNVTDALKVGASNVLAVEVFAPTENDLAITFVDWNPAPPDKNMGLWRDVYLKASGPVAVRYPAVVSKVNSPANDAAQLTNADPSRVTEGHRCALGSPRRYSRGWRCW
jgi:hypothetical protein